MNLKNTCPKITLTLFYILPFIEKTSSKYLQGCCSAFGLHLQLFMQTGNSHGAYSVFSCDHRFGYPRENSFHRQKVFPSSSIKIDVAAILNDTTGFLMACSWKNPKYRIGMIIGTGTNACYLEDIDNVGTCDADNNEPKH